MLEEGEEEEVHRKGEEEEENKRKKEWKNERDNKVVDMSWTRM